MVGTTEIFPNLDRKGTGILLKPPLSPLSSLRIGRKPHSGEKPGSKEPDYEEVGPPRKNSGPQNGQHCDICGSVEAAVSCDKCSAQAFCRACDDMYHRHPRRSTHVRKAVEVRPAQGGQFRPPLPPKGVDNHPVPPPQPPPRKNKRAGFLSAGSFGRKDQFLSGSLPSLVQPYDQKPLQKSNTSSEAVSGGGRGGSPGKGIMGSIRKFMSNRPLPQPPVEEQQRNRRNEDKYAGITAPMRVSKPLQPKPFHNSSLPNGRAEEPVHNAVPPIGSNSKPFTSASVPSTPPSAFVQYPPLQPKQQPPPKAQTFGRKFSLQQFPTASAADDKRASMVEASQGSIPWEVEAAKSVSRMRSQSVSEDQWAQMMASQGADLRLFPGGNQPSAETAPAGPVTRRGYSTQSSTRTTATGRGMVSSASVCDLNTLSQQQPQQQQQPNPFSMHSANSFQQLNMMGYPGNVMWAPPCDFCQAPPMYPQPLSSGGMKRTASNISMNLSSMGSDVTGYPWPPVPHMHHHMPMCTGFYPGYPAHMMGPMSMQGSAVSIPDSMQSFCKVPSSPAPSLRSMSHRSHKSTKARSFSTADVGNRRRGTRSRKHSEESEESQTSSESDRQDDDESTLRSGYPGGGLAWQCEYCTFINPGNVRTCCMCSKPAIMNSGRTSRRGSDRKRHDRKRDRKADHDDIGKNISDYDNDHEAIRSNFSFSAKDYRRESRSKINSVKSPSKTKKKSRRKSSFESPTPSGSEGLDDDKQMEWQLKDLRISSKSRSGDYESISIPRSKERDRNSHKKEGKKHHFRKFP